MHIGILLNNALVVAEFCLKEFAGKVSKILPCTGNCLSVEKIVEFASRVL